jgi:hypothetical protein
MIGKSLVFATKYSPIQRFLPVMFLLILVFAPTCSLHAQGKADDQFLAAVDANFHAWDTDRNQFLSTGELDAAIKDPANTGPAAAALAALKNATLSTNFNMPPLTIFNIYQLVSRRTDTNQPNLPRLYLAGLKRINALKNGQLFDASPPRLETIHQGHLGDCFCLAPIGAMVHRDPSEVATMFSMSDENHYVVRFGTGSVIVPMPTDAERAMGRMAFNGRDGLWVDVYEEAIAQVYGGLNRQDNQTGLSIDAIANGGQAGRILSDLTGHKVTGLSLAFAANPLTPAAVRERGLASLRRKLSDASAQKRLVTCSTKAPTTPALNPKHVYALLEYDSVADTVQLWNPHGNQFNPKGPPGLDNGYPTQHGVFTMPVAEFAQQFAVVSIEGTEQVARQ